VRSAEAVGEGVREIRIYYEGNGLLKPGFSEFFMQLRERARQLRWDFRLIPAGSGPTACRDFGIALRTHADAWNILLIDSEGPLAPSRATDLCRARGWDRSVSASVFWMVEMMEAWFHADKDALESFYGRGFRKEALKARANVEEIPKADITAGLHEATRHTNKGSYFENKTSHGPRLLEAIRAEKVRAAAPNCNRLFEAVLGRLTE
jgi:hypothetical protein